MGPNCNKWKNKNVYCAFHGTQGHLTKWNKHIWKQTKQRINGVPVSQHGGNSRNAINTTTSTAENSTLHPEVNLHRRAKQQQKSRNSRAKHLKTPPSTTEQQLSNIALSQGRPQQQRRATKEPGGEQPRGCGEGRSSRAAMDSPQWLIYVCLEVSFAMLTADWWG